MIALNGPRGFRKKEWNGVRNWVKKLVYSSLKLFSIRRRFIKYRFKVVRGRARRKLSLSLSLFLSYCREFQPMPILEMFASNYPPDSHADYRLLSRTTITLFPGLKTFYIFVLLRPISDSRKTFAEITPRG